MRVSFTLTGLTALLLHADDVEAADALSEWRTNPANKNARKPGDDRSPPWTWQTYLYSDGAHMALPSENMMVCLRQAGTQMILRGQKTLKELTQSGLLIPSEFLTLCIRGAQIPMSAITALRDLPFSEQSTAVKELGFRLLAKRAAVGKAKHVRVRARLDDWSLSGELLVHPFAQSALTLERLRELFTIAGRCGLGDWRPAGRTPGVFGMFDSALKIAK